MRAGSGFTFVEPCCGSASLTLHLLGARRPLLPYQGSKWRFRHALTGVMARLGVTGRPAAVRLSDPSPWGRAMGAVLTPQSRRAVAAHLRELAARDARTVFEALNGAPAPAEDDSRFAAEFLFLQRLSFSGKAVGIKAGRWSSPGFNVSSAYGLAATERFGAVNPMIPSLLRVLDGYERDLASAAASARHGGAIQPPERIEGRWLVYVDPPYAGSTPYPDGALSRREVVALARAWKAAGAAVMVSEASPIPELVAEGWSCERLYAGRDDTSPFRGKQEEWVTACPAAQGS